MINTKNIIESRESLSAAMHRLNELPGSEMTLIVVDSGREEAVSGTLTDGDVRRALLRGVSLDRPVADAMFRDFRYLRADDADNVDAVRAARSAGITLLPVLDISHRLVDIVDLSKTPSRLPLKAILMAGGKGERLRPMTDDTPKPLLKVGDKAIIDYNIEALARAGITDITVTTRHLAKKLHDHFATPVAGVKVRCITETMPLGTIGSATLVEHKAGGNTLIMNSDLLTTVSFEEMYLKHRDSRAQITVGVIPYQVSVPYAILCVDGDNVQAIEEKPSYSHYANAGIYIFGNEVLAALKKGERADAPDVIRDAVDRGLKVTYHVINGTWIDIGSPTDFRQAEQLMRHHRNLAAVDIDPSEPQRTK